MAVDLSARYKVAGYEGIAFYCIGYEVVRDEDYEWSGIEHENTDRIRMVMVGDDAVHVVDVEDITKIEDHEYCPECGQIGCKASAYPNDNDPED